MAFFFVGRQKVFCESSLKASKWFHSLPLDAISEYSSLALNGGGVCDERKKALERRKNSVPVGKATKDKNKEEKWHWMKHEENNEHERESNLQSQLLISWDIIM